MSLSGINISGEIIAKFEEDRMKSEGARLVLRIENDEMVIDGEGKDLLDMVSNLPDAEPRYVIYDIPIQNRANLTDLKTVFILWMPMESPVRMRMMYSSTKAQITNNIRGITASIQAEEKDELALDKIQAKVVKTQGINNY
ncbi:MAG: hypothetical protein ACXAE3_00780 [Candidatus Kariarchaeaceae archaeon]|jgi:cofilin